MLSETSPNYLGSVCTVNAFSFPLFLARFTHWQDLQPLQMADGVLLNNLNQLHVRQKEALEKPRAFRKRCDNRSHKERRESALMARLKKKSIWNDLNDHWALTDQLATGLAVKHGRTIAWIRKQLFQTGRVHLGRRAVSKYNAWVHCKSLVVNEGK